MKPRHRILILQGLVLVAVTVLVVRLHEVQIVEGSGYEETAEERLIHEERSVALRGSIFDRDGVPLVRSEPAYHLGVRVEYFRRSSPSGILHSVLDAVRGAIEENRRPVAIPYAELFADSERFVDVLLRHCRKSDLLRVPDRWYRHEIYERLVVLLELPSKRELVRAIEDAASDETLEEIVLDAPGGPLQSEPYRVAIAALDRERERLTELALRLEQRLDWLIDRVAGTFRRADSGFARDVERAVAERMEGDPETDEAAARRTARREAFRDHPFRIRDLARRIDHVDALDLFLRADEYPGFSVREDQSRQLLAGAPVHLIGNVIELTKDRIDAGTRELEEVRRGERTASPRSLAWAEHLDSLEEPRGRSIGISGLERSLDPVLQGRPGEATIRRDYHGRAEEVLKLEPAIPGCDVHLTLDAGLQSDVEGILASWLEDLHQAGSVILMDPSDGAIRAMASFPAPASIENERDIAPRRDDPNRSLLNRSVKRAPFPYPGSTFKIVAAAAALEEGLVTRRSTYPCPGHYPGVKKGFGCLGVHHDIAIDRAMIKSCNVYFYFVGQELGGERLAAWARHFGFGELTGIELFEDPGFVRSPSNRLGRPWLRGDPWFLAIGQVNVEVTPLQVVRMAAAIGNGGTLVRPHLVESGGVSDTLTNVPARSLDLQPSTLAALQSMMRNVVKDGEGGTAEDQGLDVFEAAAKTGTAETAQNKPTHAWIVGYAPASNPQVAFVVYRELCDLHGGEGAGPIAAECLEAFFARESAR